MKHPRYKPESIDWNSPSLIYRACRLFETIFGRRYGVKAEVSLQTYIDDEGNKKSVHFAHSLESSAILLELGLYSCLKRPFSALAKLPRMRVYIPVMALPTGISVPASPYIFAIAFDSVLSTVNHASPSTSVTDSFTNTAGDTIVTGVVARDAGDVVTTCTYNAVSLSLVKKQQENAAPTYAYAFGKVAPATGAHNIVTSFTGSPSGVRVGAVSYSGTNQSSFPDASTTYTGTATSFSNSLTTVADNCWVVIWVWNESGNNVAGTGSTLRGTSANPAFLDSNAAVHPAGSYNMAVTWGGGSTGFAAIMLSIAPPSSAVVNSNFLACIM